MRLVRTYKKTLSFFDFFFLSTNSLLLPISATQTTIPTNRQVSAMILILKKKKHSILIRCQGQSHSPKWWVEHRNRGQKPWGPNPFIPNLTV